VKPEAKFPNQAQVSNQGLINRRTLKQVPKIKITGNFAAQHSKFLQQHHVTKTELRK
jgi:hypothetical protein